jgi:hypothetical protein
VLAFEPAEFAFAKLKKNLSLNPELQVHTLANQILLTASLDDPPEAEICLIWPPESLAEGWWELWTDTSCRCS